jgi:NAD(P)H-dependent flavin oxidoreductase YrpB (nitropropane dioxygenase family)
VAAVSEAGGFGVLGVGGAPEVVQERIDGTRALTRHPFGVNVIIDEIAWATTEEDRELVRAEVLTAIHAQVAAVVLFWGIRRRTSIPHTRKE